MGGYRNISYLHNPCMCVRVEHNMVVSSGIETASGLIDCSLLMIPMHESLKDSTEIVAYPNKQE